MTVEEQLQKVMDEQTEIALATSVEGQPNVRIVNFFYEPEKKCIYFSTFKDNAKVNEFEKNRNVSFTTIPVGEVNHARVHKGVVKKSEQSIYDVAEQWITKIPSYAENIEHVGNMLVLYEIHFAEVTLIMGMNEKVVIKLK